MIKTHFKSTNSNFLKTKTDRAQKYKTQKQIK